MPDLRSLSDEELVHCAQQGDVDAFTALYERYLGCVYSRVRYLVPDTDVMDVTQEVFIAVMRSLRSFRCEALFRTWLRTITQRQIANYYRQRKPEEASLDAEDGKEEITAVLDRNNPAPAMAAIDDHIILSQALRTLPDSYREILLLRFGEGLQFTDIAQAQGKTLDATKSLFRRAVAALQKQVDGVNVYGS